MRLETAPLLRSTAFCAVLIFLICNFSSGIEIGVMSENAEPLPTVAQNRYQKAYRDALAALAAVSHAIHDLPAPGGEIEINWGHVGDMIRIATDLRAIADRNL